MFNFQQKEEQKKKRKRGRPSKYETNEDRIVAIKKYQMEYRLKNKKTKSILGVGRPIKYKSDKDRKEAIRVSKKNYRLRNLLTIRKKNVIYHKRKN